MFKINVAYVKINQNHEILDYNRYFSDYCGLDANCKLKGLVLSKLDYLPSFNLNQLLSNVNTDGTMIAFSNKNFNKQTMVAITYVSIKKTDKYTIIRFSNWLNWINALNLSMDNAYSDMSRLNKNHEIQQYVQISSEAGWFKALYPLLTHIPNNLSNMISSWAVFDILHCFVQKRGENKYTKDYNRDTLSRIKNSIKKYNGIIDIDIRDILDSNQFVNLKYGDELFIPYSGIKDTILFAVKADNLLEHVIDLSSNV